MIKRLSLFITLVAIFAIFNGLITLLNVSSQSILNLIIAIFYIVAGIGLLFQKFWALRIIQGLIIISIFFTFAIFLYPELPFLYSLIFILIFDSLLVLLLIYLNKEKVVAQFIDLDDNTENLETDKKESTSLIPVFRTITFLAYWLFVILLFAMAVSYAFEWWGNWAYLLLLGLIFPIIPFSGLISSIVLFPPIFIFIFWRYEGVIPWWFIGLSVLCFISQYILSFLIFKETSEVYDTNKINQRNKNDELELKPLWGEALVNIVRKITGRNLPTFVLMSLPEATVISVVDGYFCYKTNMDYLSDKDIFRRILKTREYDSNIEEEILKTNPEDLIEFIELILKIEEQMGQLSLESIKNLISKYREIRRV